MAPARWEDVDRVWHAVLARPEPDREVAMAELCGSDPQLRREVESMLAHLARASAAGFGSSAALQRDHAGLLGRTLGPYTVQTLLGVGGMGQVYRAHDRTLGRDVAVKILPTLSLADPAWRAQFNREARLLASLNHPNIGAIYGVHEGDGVRALILELVEGDTLADAIARRTAKSGARRGLAIPDVRTIASQVAEALAAAHDRGVVHRDLKPANIKVTADMRVKVLDFGLALAVGRGESGPELLEGSDDAPGGVAESALAGTPAYMSPEQARGWRVDRRTDVWAFGCVLYEMLTGAQAFGRADAAAMLAAAVGSEPDWSLLPRETPPTLRLCLRRCLEKNPRRRVHDMADVRLILEGAFEHPGVEAEDPSVRRRGWAAVAGAAVATLALIAAGAAGFSRWANGTTEEAQETRLQIVTPGAEDPFAFALSPDGRRLVLQAGEGQPQLWLRRLESEEAEPLPGTSGATMPFWSPDSRSVGFFADGLLKRIDLADGSVRTLARAPQPRRGAWNEDGAILFGAASIGPLLRVQAEGGPVRPATTLLPGQTNHRWPQFLARGRFLLFALGKPEVRGLYAGSLTDAALRRVSDRELAYWFMPPTHLLLARQGGLWARTLPADLSESTGESVAVAPKVAVSAGYTGYGAFSSSSTGAIAYRASAGKRQLVWLDRAGRVLRMVGQADDSDMTLHHLSSDGRTAGVQRIVDGNVDAWLVDTDRGVTRRLTSDPAFDGNPVFSPDGTRVAYVTDGKTDVYQIHGRPSDGTGGDTMLFESPENKNPGDWSSDGRYLLYANQSGETQYDLWALPMVGERRPIQIARTPFNEAGARFSPDARWVAFVSNETGRTEVYVQRFPTAGPKAQVSVGGGASPRWRRDGRELFYVAPDNHLMAVPLVLGQSHVDAAAPQALFVLPGSTEYGYETAADGQRFLASTAVSDPSPITLILNWKSPRR